MINVSISFCYEDLYAILMHFCQQESYERVLTLLSMMSDIFHKSFYDNLVLFFFTNSVFRKILFFN